MPELRAHGGRGLPLASQRERKIRWPLSLLAVAASLVFVVFTSMRDPEPDSAPRAGAGESITQSLQAGSQTRTLAEAQRNLDPVRWWEQVHDRDWVGQTMPTVRSVQQGVAPLGRTLMRAVNILAIGGRDQTS